MISWLRPGKRKVQFLWRSNHNKSFPRPISIGRTRLATTMDAAVSLSGEMRYTGGNAAYCTTKGAVGMGQTKFVDGGLTASQRNSPFLIFYLLNENMILGTSVVSQEYLP